MRCKHILFISILAVLLVLAGCAKAECKKDVDCQKTHYTGACVDKKCDWTPIPNECGNGQCEASANENKCTCGADCGECTGTAGKYLTQQCNNDNECVEDIVATAQKPITQTRELTTGGSKISVTSTFNQPFNIKKDQLELEFGLNVLPTAMSDLTITRLELTGMQDKRTIPLADKTVDKHLYSEGSKFKERLILDFPGTEQDGELTSLNLKVYLDYVQTTGTTVTPKSTTLSHAYQSLKFTYARPAKSPGCPTSCDDANPGTQDLCDETTNYFCENKQIPGACGNGVCDGTENKCTCAQDCGPCSGTIGTYLTRSCISGTCVAQLRTGVTAQPQSQFDDRDMSVFHLQNTYKFTRPFNTKTDKLTLEFTLYEKQDTVSSVKIKDIRVLDGTQEVAYVNAGKELTSAGQKEVVDVPVPAQSTAEVERSLNLRVWYEYVQNSETKQGDYSKGLGKVTLLSPDV